MEDHPLTLVCLSHLNWDHVWQRPQQLMSRFAQHCRVIFCDPPDWGPAGKPSHFDEQPGVEGVRVVRPRFPADIYGTPGNSYEELWARLLPELLAEAGPNTILWVFSPMADYLVAAAKPQVELVVYDCMDELANFRGSTPDMRAREARLLELADLVFTGGRSMYEVRKDRHPRVYCFPSGVDVEHYRQVRDPATPEANALMSIPHPRLGYFGVLDERIDWELIAAVAEQRPAWQWVLVGPTAKVAPEELPQLPNVHYLGQQTYADLPTFLKGFDIATMPFALSEATRFISPTKTPEYLAGGKAVISTPVPDVVAQYSGIVYLADDADAWITTVEKMLAASCAERERRLAQAQPILAESSWDSTVERMWGLMEGRMGKEQTV